MLFTFESINIKYKFAYMKKSTLLLFSVLLFIFSCDSDFDVNADWKESMVVYGLLDQSVDTQKVIIYKAFLGNQSAYALAQEIDSIYYGEKKKYYKPRN